MSWKLLSSTPTFDELLATVCPVCGKTLAEHRVQDAEWSAYTTGTQRGEGRLNLEIRCVFAWPGDRR